MPEFNENTIYRVIVSPVQHFYVAVPTKEEAAKTGIRFIEAHSMKRAQMYVPAATAELEIVSYDEYKEMARNA